MKNYMIMCMAVVALLFASCKNEDISISREVSFEVNPYTVIKDFVKHQVYEDDLETFSSGDMLRVHLFVYDTNGDLVASDMQYLNGYRSTMNSKFELADGIYSVVATSDVATLSSGDVAFEYWEFTGYKQLSELKIKDSGYLGQEDKILGVSFEKITVAAGQINHIINLVPAGALIVVQFNGIHSFSDVVTYRLLVNKNSDYCSFSNGDYQPVINESTTYNWQLDFINVSNYPNNNNLYGYKFVLPLGRTDFIWRAELDDSYLLLDDTYNKVDIKQGKMYNCVFAISEITCDFYEFGNNKSLINGGDWVRVRNTDKVSSCTNSIK